MTDIQIQDGFPIEYTPEAANLFWRAFIGKLSIGLGPDDKALEFLERVINPTHAISAIDHEGELLGVAGSRQRTAPSLAVIVRT